MDTPTLVLLLVVAAAFVIFGPRPKQIRAQRDNREKPIKIKHVERASALTPLYPDGRIQMQPNVYAAGRAPSPLQQRAQQRPAPQFATAKPDAEPGDWQDARLPYEMPDWD